MLVVENIEYMIVALHWP